MIIEKKLPHCGRQKTMPQCLRDMHLACKGVLLECAREWQSQFVSFLFLFVFLGFCICVFLRFWFGNLFVFFCGFVLVYLLSCVFVFPFLCLCFCVCLCFFCGFVFLWWCDGVFVVVFLFFFGGGVFVVVVWWCFCGGGVVVFLWWCFVVMFFWWCFSGGVFLVVLWLCFCGGVFLCCFVVVFCGRVVVVFFCGGKVIFLWWWSRKAPTKFTTLVPLEMIAPYFNCYSSNTQFNEIVQRATKYHYIMSDQCNLELQNIIRIRRPAQTWDAKYNKIAHTTITLKCKTQ